jgi:FHA domain-containing protein
MAELTLSVISVDNLPPAQQMIARFGRDGGTVGRDDTNTMPLPDKHRRVSRLHGTISYVNGLPTLANSSTSLPIVVGESQLDYGESIRLTEGIQIEFGPYIVVASLGEPARAADPALIADPFAPSASVAASPAPARETVSSIVRPPATPVPPPSPRPSPAQIPASLGAATTATAPIGAERSLLSTMPQHQAPQVVQPVSDPLASLLSSASSPGVLSSQPSAASPGDPFSSLLSGTPSNTPLIPQNDPFSAGIMPSVMPSNAVSVDPLAALGVSTPPAAPLAMPRPRVAASPSQVIPDDFNPFDMPSSASRNASDPLSTLLGEKPPLKPDELSAGREIAPPVESLFPAQSIGNVDPFAFDGAPNANVLDGSIGSLTRAQGATDPLSMFDADLVPQTPVNKPMRDDVFEIGAAFQPPNARMPGDAPLSSPQVIPPDPFLEGLSQPFAPIPSTNTAFAAPIAAAPVAVPAPMSMPPRVTPQIGIGAPVAPANHDAMSRPTAMPMANTPASTDALTQAFLTGAGLQPSALAQGLTPETMRVIGSLLRSATSGAIDMLAARAATKREVQANVTIIAVSANNPLKFLPNADAALQQLLGKKMPGFMRADLAMADAFDDLRAHEVGVIAGTRAALNEVLAKFDPAILGEKLAKGSVLEALMPSARKAKLWDQYLDRYEQIRREAEDDFQSIFGKAFVEAYERETQRIKAIGGEPK